MPGAYVHLTLANMLKETDRLDSIHGFPDEAKFAVMTQFSFCELGAVSPDYPYLALGDGDAAKWADEMHYTRTGELIHAGILRLQNLDGIAREKGLAWLLGYTSHFVADVTVHPVVFLKVGDYQHNKKEHRICEMNQDAFIFPSLNLGEIGLSEYLDSSIARCGDPTDRERLDPDIKGLWEGMLQDIYPDEFASNPPDIDKWHRRFVEVVDGISDVSEHLVPFARHVGLDLGDSGLMYPTPDDVDCEKFINSLETPTIPMSYDDIFKLAINNAARIWGIVAQGVLASSTDYQTAIGNWDLDTGKDKDGIFGLWG
jgi:hypothetical protein